GNYGGAGAVTITKSITIDCGDTSATSATSGFFINAPGIVVRLRNLTIDGRDAGGAGIQFSQGAALLVENCRVTNHTHGDGLGINFAPLAGVNAKLVVLNSVISGNSGYGIIVAPAGSASARAVIDHVRLEKNAHGVFAIGIEAGAIAIVQIRNSVLSNNAGGA